MSNKLISIIVPVFNTENYIERCIKSIVNQKYKELEIILVDDGSTDNSGKVCDEWADKDKRIKVIHQKNCGVSAARNKGLKYTTGEYVSFIDSDDYLSADCYSDLNQIIMQRYDLIKFQHYTETTKYKRKSSNSIQGEIILSNNINQGLELFFKYHELGSVCTTLFSRNAIKNISFNETWKYGEDYCFYLEVLLNSKSMYITNEPYYHYVVNEKSATHQVGKNKFLNQFKTHYEVDSYVYNKMISMEFYKYKCELLECTYKITINLTKQLAINYCYREYKQILNEVINSNYYKDYRNLDTHYRKYEFKNIIERKSFIVYLRYRFLGSIKKLVKTILR